MLVQFCGEDSSCYRSANSRTNPKNDEVGLWEYHPLQSGIHQVLQCR